MLSARRLLGDRAAEPVQYNVYAGEHWVSALQVAADDDPSDAVGVETLAAAELPYETWHDLPANQDKTVLIEQPGTAVVFWSRVPDPTQVGERDVWSYVIEGPKHGRLDRAQVTSWSGSWDFVYTPEPGYRGTDRVVVEWRSIGETKRQTIDIRVGLDDLSDRLPDRSWRVLGARAAAEDADIVIAGPAEVEGAIPEEEHEVPDAVETGRAVPAALPAGAAVVLGMTLAAALRRPCRHA